MIYLVPEVKSGLGEDTFWTWFHREISSSFDLPENLKSEDWVLQYATLGPAKGGRKVALLWELYAEMKKQGLESSDYKINKMKEAYEDSAFNIVSSPSMLEFYPHSKVMPIGVDTDIFTPRNRVDMRNKHGFGEGKLYFWCGTSHPMKGEDRLKSYAREHPDVGWIACTKERSVSQVILSELMNCADFALFTGRLRPYFMVEWEAMACDLPVIDISGMERDFIPGEHPRQDVLEQGWSRHQAKEEWLRFLS